MRLSTSSVLPGYDLQRHLSTRSQRRSPVAYYKTSAVAVSGYGCWQSIRQLGLRDAALPRTASNLDDFLSETGTLVHDVFTRRTLYERVWAEPTRTVAQSLGVSDVPPRG